MELVPGFVALLRGLSVTMTAPTFDSLTTVLTGWVFANRRTVTRMILAAGDAAGKHFSSYHRLFSAARWSLDALGLSVFNLIEPWLGSDTVLLALDDTLARQRGRKMFGTGMHHDPLLSSRSKAVTNWGHSWVVLGVLVELPFRRGHVYCLPILFRLYLNTKSAAKHRRAYRTRPELAVELLNVLCEQARVADQIGHVSAAPTRPLRVVAVEALKGGRGQEAFYSTCSDATAEQVIGWYARRWSIEVTNHDSKQHLGFEEPQGWTRRWVERTAPLAMLLDSLIVLWFAREGHRQWRPLVCPWYTSKLEPSFADMLSTLRRLSVRQQVLTLALTGPGSRKIQQLLENTVALAT